VRSEEENKNIKKKIRRNDGFDKTITQEGAASRWHHRSPEEQSGDVSP
jgi:hypothetical protein